MDANPSDQPTGVAVKPFNRNPIPPQPGDREPLAPVEDATDSTDDGRSTPLKPMPRTRWIARLALVAIIFGTLVLTSGSIGLWATLLSFAIVFVPTATLGAFLTQRHRPQDISPS